MLNAGSGISDLIFSPGRPPQVEVHGELVKVSIPSLPMLRAEDTAQIARDLIDGNEYALRTLRDQGACDLSYSVPERARFRVNVFRQRGSYAIVMRVIATNIPTLEELKLPPGLSEIASLKNGIVLVTGPTGSGKSIDAGGIRRPDQLDAAPTTSSPSRTRSSSCTCTRRAPSTSVSFTATRRRSRWRCAQPCARRPRSSWSVRCAIARRSKSR